MRKFQRATGFTILETLIVCLVMGVVAAISIPAIARTVSSARLQGDARSVANAVATAKVRAAAKFAKVRLFVNLADDTYHMEWFNKDAGTDGEWQLEGGIRELSYGVSFGAADVSTPPPNSHAELDDTLLCRTDPPASAEIGNTACVVFNSRGTPIDATGAADANGVIYLEDDSTVYGVAIAATGMTRLWRTYRSTDDSWVME